MQIKPLLISIPLATAASSSSQDFPPSPTVEGVQNLQNYINNVINDIVQSKFKQIGNDYSSTGRSLSFASRDLLPNGCTALTTGKLAQNRDEAIADLQKTQLILQELEQDIMNKDLPKAKKDVCRAVAEYGDVANYVQKVMQNGP